MKGTYRLVVALAALLFGAGTAGAEILNFSASIDGAQAANCAGTGSAGTGSGTFTLDTVTGQVDYSITFSGLTGTETVAHVHGPAAACAPGGVVYGLPPGSPKIGTTTLSAGQQDDMIAGLHYVNIHSDVEPGGEIRGQILLQVGAVPAVSQWGMLAMVLIMAAVATIVFCRMRTLRA